MLFIGEYAIADSDADLIEMLHRFEDDEDSRALVIIDDFNRIEHIKELRSVAEMGCFVVFLQPGLKHTETRKGIYLHHVFDATAMEFVQANWASLVFFQ